MYVAMPCPSALESACIRQDGVAAADYDGFWVVSQDPSTISDGGGIITAIGDTIEELQGALDIKLNVLFGFTRIIKHSLYTGRWRSHGLTQEAVKLIELFGMSDNNGGNWYTAILMGLLGALCVEKTNDSIDDLTVMAQAKVHPKGVIWYRADVVWPISEGKTVEPIADGFVTKNTLNGQQIVFNPRQYKSLMTRRKRAPDGMSVTSLKNEYTLSQCCSGVVRAYSDVINNHSSVGVLYYRRWGLNGIDDCLTAIPKLHSMIVQLRLVRHARKKVRNWIRLLSYYEPELRRRAYAESVNWYETELKAIGGKPKQAIALDIKRRKQLERRTANAWAVSHAVSDYHEKAAAG